jgi:hypothetical protein
MPFVAGQGFGSINGSAAGKADCFHHNPNFLIAADGHFPARLSEFLLYE